MKTLLSALLATLLTIIVIPMNSSAYSIENLPGDSFYASVEEQKLIYDAFVSCSHGMKKYFEFYNFHMLSYAQTGVLNMDRYSLDEFETVYVAKVVNDNGKFVGSVTIHMINNDIVHVSYRPSFDSPQTKESIEEIAPEYYEPGKLFRCEAYFSYADHAERIQNILGSDKMIHAAFVRIVWLQDFTQAFYVRYNNQDYIIDVGYQWATITEDREPILVINVPYQTEQCTPVGDDLKKIADGILERHNEEMAEIQAWQKEHPGEQYPYFGSGMGNFRDTNAGEVNDILNIREYLNLHSGNAAAPIHNNPQKKALPWGWIFTGICFLGMGGIVCAICLRQKKTN